MQCYCTISISKQVTSLFHYTLDIWPGAGGLKLETQIYDLSNYLQSPDISLVFSAMFSAMTMNNECHVAVAYACLSVTLSNGRFLVLLTMEMETHYPSNLPICI